MRNQEIDIKECGEVLLSRVRKFEPWIAKEIVHQILSRDTPLQNRQYASDSDEKIRFLIDEAKKCMKPKARSPGRDFPIPSWKSQVQPSTSSDGIQAPIPPAGQSEPSQIPVDKCIGLEEQLPSSSIPDDGMPGCSNVIGCSPSSSELWPQPCHSYISTGVCRKALQDLPCGFSHGFGSLGVLEMEIRLILMNLGAVRVASLQTIYVAWYCKPLQAKGWHGNPGSLTSLLLRLHTTRLITNSYEELHIVLLEHAPAYLGNFADSCNAMDAGSGAHQIYFTFSPESRFRFTEQDVHNYFSWFGPAPSVRISRYRSFGFVSFLYPETVRLLLSEWNPRVPHFIGMSSPELRARVFIKRYKEEAEQRNSAEKHALKNGCDPGLVTEKSSVTIAPEMAPPLTHCPPSHSQRESNSLEDKDVTRSQHVSDDLDEASPHQHTDDVLASLPDIDCFYEAT